MATSGPITYLVMDDQFPLSCRASRAPATEYGNARPAHRHEKGTGCAGGDARERPVFPARTAGLPQAVLGTGGGAVRPRPGSVPVVLPGRRQVRAAHRAGARPGPRARWPGRLALVVARRAARAVCRRPGPGARRPHRGHRRLAACPQTWPAMPPASAAARGPRLDASLPGPGAVPHPPLVRVPCPSRCPRPGPGGMRYTARHQTIARLPLPGHRAVGMIPAQPSPAPSPPWPGSDGAAPGIAGAAGMAWRDWRWRAATASCGQPLVPTGPQSPVRIFRIIAF